MIEWKDIDGFEGLYQVSNTGAIKSLERWKKNHYSLNLVREKFLKICPRKDLMCRVNLWKDGKGKTYFVHRLVANTFIPNPENKPQVNHIDGNRLNNHIDNLEWNTNAENTQHSYDYLGRKGAWEGKLGKNHPQSKKMIQKHKITGEKIKFWGSIAEIERELGITNILPSIKRKGTAGGFKWEYA